MKNRNRRNQYHGHKNISPKEFNTMLSIQRSMPFSKRFKLSIWLVGYSFIAVCVIAITATVVGMHYV